MAEKKEKRYVSDNAQLMAEWNWERNDGIELDPKTLTLGSGKKAWWKCEKGHEWIAIVNNRNKGRRCPICSSNKLQQGSNDLQTINPTLAKEWNCEKNVELTPVDVLPNSNKKVWWKCGQGHEWQAKIQVRTKGASCPQCAREKRNSAK